MKSISVILRLRKLLEKPYFPPIVLLIIAAICYLPLAGKLGFYNDDWYLIYAGTSQGSAKFLEVFEIDRPLRGYLVGFLFDLYGTNPLPYSISAYLLRCLGAFGLLWLLRQIWPKARMASYLAAVWLVIYPGFLDQPNAIDYQSHLVSFTLAIFSIYFSVRALYAPARWVRGIWILLAILLQLIYLGLMEYYIGLEGLRLCLIGYVVLRRDPVGIGTRFKQAALHVLPTFLGAASFFAWRTYIFDGQRQATNVGTIFADVAGSPVLRILWMLALQVQDFLNAVFIAWFEPVYRLAFQLRLKYTMEMLAWVGAALLLFTLAVLSQKNGEQMEQETQTVKTPGLDMIGLGVLGVVSALLPIHLGERHIVFQDFSRFSLPSAPSAVILLAGLWQLQNKSWWRWMLPGLMILLASMTHYANARIHVENWQTVKDFWWQVAWRIPQVEPQTVLVASYPDQGIAEDYFVWGPANLIYYPNLPPSEESPLILLGATLNLSDIQAIQAGLSREFTRRGFSGGVDFSKTLVLTMPSSYSCVHVLDGERPELSNYERPEISLVAPYSHLNLIDLSTEGQNTPEAIFGEEPAHGWCYYYQQAALARQRGDWKEIVRLGDDAEQMGIRASDWIEWMPFIEGYAYQGIDGRVSELSAVIREDMYLRLLACELVLQDIVNAAAHPQGHQLLIDSLCEGK